MNAEQQRLKGPQREEWLDWGTYVAERCWGTIREHPGKPDECWEAFPFQQARSRAYRWSEDALAGWCDRQQRLVLAPAFWNGRDPHLKERLFGLTNPQGLHGEELKEIMYHLFGTPSYSYMQLLYRYPQRAFPYQKLIDSRQRQGMAEKAIQLRDLMEEDFAAGRYFDLNIEYAKSGPREIFCRVSTQNPGPEPAELHILAQAWLRRGSARHLQLRGDRLEIGGELDGWRLSVEQEPAHWWFCDNETNQKLLFQRANQTEFPKDGIDRAVTQGDHSGVNPKGRGSKAAAHWHKRLEPGEEWQVTWRLSASAQSPPESSKSVFLARAAEAVEFYREQLPDHVDEEERLIHRQAISGLCWSQNYYHFCASEWLQGDPKLPFSKPPSDVDHSKWPEFAAHDVLPMPDSWEYPWLAAWDIAFHLYVLNQIDPTRARQQMQLLLSRRFTRPDGAIASFEGSLTGPHPPVLSWAAWALYCEGKQDPEYLETIYAPLARHYQFWLCTHQPGDFLFDGGFMGQDNAGPWDRSQLPEGAKLLQADTIGWVGCLLLHLFGMAVELGRDVEAAAYLADFQRMQESAELHWCQEERFYYDCLHERDQKPRFVRARSFAGLVPILAVMPLKKNLLEKLPRTYEQLRHQPANSEGVSLLSLVPPQRFLELMKKVLDPEEFLSSFGIRSLSRHHQEHPLEFELNGKKTTLQYEPGEGCTLIQGGNSNWRGPIWAPLNLRLIEALHRYGEYLTGDCLRIVDEPVSCALAAERLSKLFLKLFLRNDQGYRPIHGDDPARHDAPCLFYEYFHADEGLGLGAAHQTGWTAVVARLIKDAARPGCLWPQPHRAPSESASKKLSLQDA